MYKNIYRTERKYNLILIDPPWKNGPAYKTPYPCMAYEEIKELPIQKISAKNCALLVWTTTNKIEEAIKLMNDWGFKYVNMFMVWIKLKKSGGLINTMGYYTKQTCEYILLGKKGSIFSLKIKHTKGIPNCIVKRVEEHSVKPRKKIQEIIGKIFLNVPKIEIFSRHYDNIEWDYWGNQFFEVSKFKIKDIINVRLEQDKLQREIISQKKKMFSSCIKTN